MKHIHFTRRILSAILSAALIGGLVATSLSAMALEIPKKAELKTGVSTYSNSKAVVDYSNLAEGFVSVKYVGGKNVVIKVQIVKDGGTTYNYNLNNKGIFESFPLVEGDGKYTIRVLENTSGSKYAQAFTRTVMLKLRSDFLPYLYPNQYVNFTDTSAAVLKAAELVKDDTTTLEKLTSVYNFVVKTLTYDMKKAETVQSGYLPVVDTVLAEKTGICFDYAALMSAMLRSQNIPCKLVVGYAGTAYHAWINVYVENEGWIEKAVFFDGKNWTLMDPTYASTGGTAANKFIGNGANYTQKYAY